jgi:hypothetical protein
MAKEAYDKVSELASRCLSFAQTTCQQWREQTSGKEPGWQGLNEPRELYFALQMLQHKAEAVLDRATILRSLYGAAEQSR